MPLACFGEFSKLPRVILGHTLRTTIYRPLQVRVDIHVKIYQKWNRKRQNRFWMCYGAFLLMRGYRNPAQIRCGCACWCSTTTSSQIWLVLCPWSPYDPQTPISLDMSVFLLPSLFRFYLVSCNIQLVILMCVNSKSLLVEINKAFSSVNLDLFNKKNNLKITIKTAACETLKNKK